MSNRDLQFTRVSETPTISKTMNSPKSKVSVLKIAIVACIAIACLCLSPRLVGLLGDSSAVANVSDKLTLIEPPPQSQLITKPIEEIRCGDRIPSELPLGLLPEDEAEPDQSTWRLVELEVLKEDGNKVEVKLLRPLKWLQQAGAIENGTFSISIKELDIEGVAAVLRMLPCPPIEPGDGHVVTGTFRHTCESLVELRVGGESESIVCTTGHPIWSETSKDFVAAAELSINESIKTTQNRISTLSSVVSLPSDQTKVVFNIEVSQTHVYHVGSLGMLVHNAVVNCEKWAKQNVKRNGGKTGKVDGIANSGIPVPMKDGDGNIVNEMSDLLGGPFKMHTVVVRDGKIFDQNFPRGVEKSKWLQWVSQLAEEMNVDVSLSDNLTN